MRVLFIVGYCLRINSSANLCHASYINGFIEAGHSVDVLTVDEKNQKVDNSIEYPKADNFYMYKASIYEQFSSIKTKGDKVKTSNNSNENNEINKRKAVKTRLIQSIKKLIRKSYGVYSTDIAWYYRAKSFKSLQEYDLVISLVFPPTSVKLANYLKKSKHVKAKKWIQIWEDPWSTDLACASITKQTKNEEGKLIKDADSVVYVSPLTLEYQKQLFPESMKKMCWYPLPSYYLPNNQQIDFSSLIFGYFGDYVSSIRNLKPFLNVAMSRNEHAFICGSTDLDVTSNASVHISPRIPINELKKYENKTNTIVFLCNLKGGQIPGKIYQYSATNKVILFILDGTENEKKKIKEYFSQFNRYVFCENNEESIKEAINKIPELIKIPSYTMPLDNFAPDKIVKEILKEVGMQ